MKSHDIVADLVEGFDFEKVHAVMVALRWRWGGAERASLSVPTVKELQETARELCLSVLGDPETLRLATGGFVVERDSCGPHLTLSFVVASKAVRVR